ncbi:flavin reductase family protein [Ignisphaera sp. 4213-co]|uniref:Flavin reductase family protein n=1 Tax=Ignisphaera cupida TaxID=3050454 RepID=A0ABD4Z8C7_9CREN|nr:flavin reductase family protein [Ignisphaera sp. 4213-co]MDK6028818.1 flavin reductase family protein [Ignisphaera sp. 4213-co]
MKSIDVFEALDLVPHPLVIVTAGDPEKPGRRGGMTAAWVSRVSWDPPLIAVAMSPKRYTYSLIKEFKAFAVNLVSKELENAAMNIFGNLSGREVDKFEKAGIKPLKAEKVVAPLIPSAPLILECKLVAEYPAGDHIIVVGEVVKAYKASNSPPMLWHESQAKQLK